MRSLTRRRILELGASAMAIAFVDGLGAAGTGCAAAAPAPAPVSWRGVDVASGAEIVVVAGALPPGAVFAGSYRSPHLGELELAQEGSRLRGQWHYQDEDRRVTGTLWGTVTGNLAELTWSEQRSGEPRSAPLEGTGYFLLERVPGAGAGSGRVRLFGNRWFQVNHGGCSPQRDGGPWTAVQLG